MKNLVFILASVIALSSCSSKAEKDIKHFYGNSVKKVSVEKLHIDSCFYEYAEEPLRLADEMIANSELASEYTNKATSYVEKLDFYMQYSNVFADEIIECRNDAKYYQSKSDSTIKAAEKSLKAYETCKKKYNVGDIYVAKFYKKDKFGKWNEMPTYQVFAYNHDGTIHEYDGENSIDAIFSAYPDAKKEMMKEVGKMAKTFVDSFKD